MSFISRHSRDRCLTPGNGIWFKALEMAALILYLVSKWYIRVQAEIQAFFTPFQHSPIPAIPAYFQTPAPHNRTCQISSLFNPVLDLALPLAPTWVSAEGAGQGQLNQGWQVAWGGRWWSSRAEGEKKGRRVISKHPGKERELGRGSTSLPQGR